MRRKSVCWIFLFLFVFSFRWLGASDGDMDSAEKTAGDISDVMIGNCTYDWYRKWINTFRGEKYVITTHDNKTLQGRISIENEAIRVHDTAYLTNYRKGDRLIDVRNVQNIRIAPQKTKSSHVFAIYIAAVAAGAMIKRCVNR